MVCTLEIWSTPKIHVLVNNSNYFRTQIRKMCLNLHGCKWSSTFQASRRLLHGMSRRIQT